MDKEYNQKRISPPIWQHDYHVLKGLHCGLVTIINKFLKKKKQKYKLLDYGCGSKPYENLFLPYVSQYVGVDIVKNSTADKVISENQKLPFKSTYFDIILSTQVLEHVKETDFYLSECSRLLKKGGFLILSTHGLWPYHPYLADYHRWTRKGLERIIESYGFKIRKFFSVLGPFASITQFKLLIVAQGLIELGSFGKIFLAIFALFGNILIWLEDRIRPPTRVSDASLFLICAEKI